MNRRDVRLADMQILGETVHQRSRFDNIGTRAWNITFF